MKLSRPRLLLFFILILLLLFNGCSKSGGMTRADEISDFENSAEKLTDEISYSSASLPSERKRIVKASMEAETRQFDRFVEKLTQSVTEVGGYIEQSIFSGYDSTYRYAEFVFRIPAEKKDSFPVLVRTLGTITSYSENATDVTGEYVDAESRLSVLKGERDALQAMLSKAESISEMLEIRKQLTETISEYESYQARLNALKQDTSYSSLTVHVREVDREALISDKDSFFGEIRTKFVNSLNRIGLLFRNFAVFILGNILYLLLIALLVTVILFLIRRKSKAK